MADRIRAFDWASTPLGPASAWPQSLKTAVDTILEMPGPAAVRWGPRHVEIYNDAFIAIARERHPGLLGKPAAIGWADVYDEVLVLLSAALAGRTTQLRGYVSMADGPAGPEERVFDADWSPLRDEAGQVSGSLQTLIETTARHRAEAALRESEARLAAALESVPAGIGLVDAEGRIQIGNEAFRRYLPGGAIPSRDLSVQPRWRAWDDQGNPLAPDRFPGARSLRGERIVPGQEMLFTGEDGQDVWTQVAAVPIRDAAGRVTAISTVVSDIDALKRTSQALRESQERQAFLLKLSDALRPLVDPAAIQEAAARILGEHLRASRVAYVEVAADEYVIARDYVDGIPSMAGRHPVAAFGSGKLTDYHAGKARVVRDTGADAHNSPSDTANFAAVHVRAGIGVPLVKDGRFVANLVVHMNAPRNWTAEEVALVEETAERTWAAVERARAEAALRQSETRFQQFADASASGLWVREAGSLTMEYVSPAISRIYAVPPDDLLGGIEKWASLIVPEDRQSALGNLEKARRGETVTHEFRIRRSADGSFRWIRNIDFPLHGEQGRIERIGGIAEDVTEAWLALEHQGVLLGELQHRTRNIMAMIRSTASRTAGGAADVEEYRTLLDGRLMALARVQTLLTRQGNTGAWLRDVIESEVLAQAHPGQQIEIAGPEIRLSPKAVEVLSMAFHELATNALKYGALSVRTGALKVTWEPTQRRGDTWLVLTWREDGAPPREPSGRRGFGSDLIEGRIPYELGGSGQISIEPGGARCTLEFPVKEGESILETDAPAPTAIFGGTLDMRDAPDLTGRRILVVEDDYYLAGDTAAALRGAGAVVLGPCPSEAAALERLASETPSHAVVDLNLGGGGPRFEVARALTQRAVPYLFVTGYDTDDIPAEFADVARLQKPVDFRRLVEALSQLTPSPPPDS